MFPLRKRQLIRGCAAHIKAGLGCGADWEANQDKLFLPFTGKVETYFGNEGGNWLRLTRDDNGHRLEFAHLAKYLIKSGHYNEGAVAAITGNSGAITTGPHLHCQILVNGKRVDPDSYDWNPIQMTFPLKLKTQIVFNNQTFSVDALVEAWSRMKELSADRVELDFLPPIHTTFANIPSGVYPGGITGEMDTAIRREWFEENIYPLGEEADVVILVGKKGDWQYQYTEGAISHSTFGHYYSDKPPAFPLMIQIVAEEVDRSWKWPELSAITHYITHEVSHGLAQNGTVNALDRTHLYDYASVDGLKQLYNELDYESVYDSLIHKKGYSRKMLIYKKQADDTLYFAVGSKLVPFASSYEVFLKDFKDAVVIELPPDEFLKFKLASFLVVKER